MSKPEVSTSAIVTRSKKEKVINDPKQLSSEIKAEIKSKAIIEKAVVDLPVPQKVQPVKETAKTDIQVEKKVIEQSIEKKVEQSIEKKIEQKSFIEECSIFEKSKPRKEPPSSSVKDECSILEKNKPKKEELSTLIKDEPLNIVTNISKEKELSPPKKDEFISLEKNKPKEDLFSPKKDEFLNLEKNKPKEKELSPPKKDEFISLEKNKPKEDLFSPKKDESLNLEKNKSKEKELSPPKKDESISLEKNKPKESKLFFIDTNKPNTPSNVAVPRKSQPYVPPISNQPPIVLATHLVPSLPINLFEILAEMIEVATERPVVLLYEPRTNRKVASEYTDIAILPANDDWEYGELMPLSFVFEHKLNNNNSPQVYADVVVASDLVHRIEKIIDLRGHRCALPDRSKKIGAATLIYNYLHSIGEGPAFFGNTLDVDSQIDAMQMVAGKQAEVGILEAPVITCHKYNFPGIQSLYIVDSLGPLPPYRFMVNKKISEAFVKKLTSYLLNCNEDASWMMKLAPFGITGFAINTLDYYVFSDVKPVFSRGAYY
ncbi:PREDICTED: zonadhesin-like isoform X1 [Polistes canadensis]|uniref:zonadhesin-like isoform X1 n=1 Tax=Polistes canadensis TaxID=91411 RepID=UPI000718C102|nr:PREDICTED: zonadhesin-like isoform X1 [Polistes canadensis]